MPVDVYTPCPCGSGKKFKFCCYAAADEIEQVRALEENNQPLAALQVLDRVAKRMPDLPWVHVNRASILLNEGQTAEARQSLEGVVAREPGHLFGLALFATADFAVHGFEAARPNIYKAFQKCAQAVPQVVAGLAMGIAASMFAREKHLACRQHLTLALRLVRDREQQDVFVRMLEFDGNAEVFYPLRSVHELAAYTADGERGPDVRKAFALAHIGCWGPSGRLFARLAESDAESPALWQNIGLCRAWDGEEASAAEALHRAAQLHADFETGVELETLAQILDLHADDNQVPLVTVKYNAASVSRLLSELSRSERIKRLRTPPRQDDGDHPPAGLFAVLDRPHTSVPTGELTINDVPCILGHLAVFDAVPEIDEPPSAWLSGFDGEELATARSVVETAAGDLVDEAQPDDEPLREAMPRELRAMYWSWSFPDKLPVIVRRRLERERWQHTVDDIWPNLSLAALGGRAPREVVGDAGLRLPLAAALYVLDAFCDRNRFELDLAALRERYGLERPQPLAVEEDMPLTRLSVMQMHRLPVDRLNDEQLHYIQNRAALLHQSRFLYAVLTEVLKRPELHPQVDLNRAYLTLVELCRLRCDRDEALRWIERGRDNAQSHEQAFELALNWNLRELILRLEDPADPQLRPLAERLKRQYAAKLPDIGHYVDRLLATFDPEALSGPLSSVAETAGTPQPGEIWTPADEGAAAGERKLWLPGQD